MGGDWYLDRQALANADRILTGIKGGACDDVPEVEEYRQLWNLVTAGTRVKRAFVERCIEDDRSHLVLAEHMPRVATALFGLYPEAELRAWTLDLLLNGSATSRIDHPEETRFRALYAASIDTSASQRFDVQAENIALLVFDAALSTTDGGQLHSLRQELAALGARLPAAQAEAVASRLVEAMAATTDGNQLASLGEALAALGARLPAAQAEAVASRLVEVVSSPRTNRGAFVQLAKVLGALQVPKNAQALGTAPDLLQAPMGFGETRRHLLSYYSRLAGLPDDAGFETNEDLVTWARRNRPDLDLAR